MAKNPRIQVTIPPLLLSKLREEADKRFTDLSGLLPILFHAYMKVEAAEAAKRAPTARGRLTAEHKSRRESEPERKRRLAQLEADEERKRITIRYKETLRLQAEEKASGGIATEDSERGRNHREFKKALDRANALETTGELATLAMAELGLDLKFEPKPKTEAQLAKEADDEFWAEAHRMIRKR